MGGHVTLVAIVALASACASAGTPSGQPVDASGRADSPRGVDAPSQIDAASAACASGAACASATNLGSVSGDTNNDMLTASGYQSAWYSVRVTEDDSGVFGVPMHLTTQLTSPAGAAYDLFTYVNTGTDVVECTTPSGSPTASGTTESVALNWGEQGTFSNGKDDSRTVSIEIRPKAGANCSASAPWQLTVIGDL